MKLPLITRKAHEKALREAEVRRSCDTERLRKENEEERARLREQTARLARVEFARSPDRRNIYEMRLSFDESLFGRGCNTRDDYRLLARMIADRVEAEIASCRFVRQANESYAKSGRDGFPNA